MKQIQSFFITLFSLLIFSSLNAENTPEWLRYPSISPDGQTIAFSYKGDLYTVPTTGGEARQLTTNEAYDYSPVWSHNGKTIAFASDRYGNFDIYTIPSDGGTPTRLTFWSGTDVPMAFSPDDSTIYYSSFNNLRNINFSQCTETGFPSVYMIHATGGRPVLFSSIDMEHINFNADGSKLLYQDKKGYEDYWRKHHHSSVCRDVWMYDLSTKKFTQLSDFKGENRNPVFVPGNNEDFYYLNEKNGSLNVYLRQSGSTTEKQITDFHNNPVRFLSVAQNGMLCYGYNGEIYTQKPDGNPQKVKINIKTDKVEPDYKVENMTSGAKEMAVSPNGKEIAFIVRGDVFVTSADYGTTVRITNTPEQERSVSFSPDGKSLVYASERNGSWDVYTSEIKDKDNKMFVYADDIEEKQITNDSAACFQPAFSPDGKEIAFLKNRTTLDVINLKSGKIRTVLDGKFNYSYSDGDQWYQWSPDGKYFAVNFFNKGGWQSTDLGLVKADGSDKDKPVNLTQSGYNDIGAGWAMNGNALMWYSDKYGMRSHGSWGAQNDIFIMFMNQESYDKFLMNKEEAEQAEETKKDDKKKKDKNDSTKIALPKVSYDIVNAKDRIVKMTVTSAKHGSCILSKNGDKLYYLAAFEKGYDLWERDFKDNTTKLLAKIGAGSAILDADKNKEHIFMLANGNLSSISASGQIKPVAFNAEFIYKPAQERQYIFNHIWQQVADKFYDKNIHGIDWKMYHDEYEQFLPYINNNYDFKELLSEMLGELNASHTGARYYPRNAEDNTAVLGMFFDPNYDGDGLKISEILEKNPMIKADSKIKPGVIIKKIDGNNIKAGQDYYRYLNHKAGKTVVLTLSKGLKTWDERVKPISQGTQKELLYKRWVKQREHLVDSLSNGTIGYVHVRAMDSRSFRDVFSKVIGQYRNKKAIIIDTRFNGGGWLHDDLATLFDGQRYVDYKPRGQYVASDPWNKWTKPSCVVMSEGNYSDASGFPYTYRALNIGKLIGMPVPGTMTAVWWEFQIDPTMLFGIPQVGSYDMKGQLLENHEIEPDIKVNDTPQSMVEGKDLQIETAVKEMLNEVKKSN